MNHYERIAVIGGGHGLSQILSGLKNYTDYLTAIVTPFDDGGSSGRLRDQYGVLSAGDFTRAILALSKLPEDDKEILDHRFRHGDYNGHTTRNGIFTAAWEIASEKDPEYAMGFMKRLAQLDENHYVYLSSLTPARLYANTVNLETGEKQGLNGENKLDNIPRPWKIENIYLNPDPDGYVPAVDAIREADMTVLAPGTHYGSIIPHILIPEIKKAVKKSTNVVYVCNLVTEPGHTDDCTAADHIEILNRYGIFPNIAIVNTTKFSPKIEERYMSEDKSQVEIDSERLSKLVTHVIETDLLLESPAIPGALHDPDKTAQALMKALYIDV